jgi:large subunit ribosomal protein L15
VLKLHELKPGKVQNHQNYEKPRHATGQVKTAGEGQDGQKSRSGGKVREGFEGVNPSCNKNSQKRFYEQKFKSEYAIVNVERLMFLKRHRSK